MYSLQATMISRALKSTEIYIKNLDIATLLKYVPPILIWIYIYMSPSIFAEPYFRPENLSQRSSKTDSCKFLEFRNTYFLVERSMTYFISRLLRTNRVFLGLTLWRLFLERTRTIVFYIANVRRIQTKVQSSYNFFLFLKV